MNGEIGALPARLQRLFVVLIHCQPANPLGLWERYKPQICDHLPCVANQHHGNMITGDPVVDYGDFLILPLLRAAHELPIFPLVCLWEIGLVHND